MSTTDLNLSIFPKGDRAPIAYFTGVAWLNLLVPKDETGNYSIGDVLFEAGSRNYWHTHPAGQILLITSGNGYYQERGKDPKIITRGDVIIIPSNIEHWHGATKESSMTHIAITNITAEGAAIWLEPVTDEEYFACHTM
jgi:4-carboxymuconolactone decarboxylase